MHCRLKIYRAYFVNSALVYSLGAVNACLANVLSLFLSLDSNPNVEGSAFLNIQGDTAAGHFGIALLLG